ncbi:cytochrome c-550 PedF [Flavisphingomonas formosensis]|uniref:cytochrome c-550 PedF n=1 Tax=Flavisphingomonas formosensis TaxID=861534 RepID=UPI0012FCD003|nr:cytochrome c-550 PedF [Sphingomonas formosensis]
MKVRFEGVALAVAAALMVGTVSGRVMAHGNVTPQPVDTSALPDLQPNNDSWVTKNPFRADPQVYAKAQKIGESAYGQNCARCHGLEAISGGIAPDLRYLDVKEDGDEWFIERCHHGSVRDGKVYMPPMGDVLGQKACWAIRSWLDTVHSDS